MSFLTQFMSTLVKLKKCRHPVIKKETKNTFLGVVGVSK